jgi:predicted DNA-binding protein with PD1-like motif
MEYGVGQVGRVVVARLFEGEDVYESVEQVARQESIRCAAVLITGGFRKADVVVGPKQEKPTIEADFRAFTGPGEALGVGTLYWDDKSPRLHIHAAIGKGGNNIVGCPRGGASVFLVLEVTLIEITGIDAMRRPDAQTGWNLLRINGGAKG